MIRDGPFVRSGDWKKVMERGMSSLSTGTGFLRTSSFVNSVKTGWPQYWRQKFCSVFEDIEAYGRCRDNQERGGNGDVWVTAFLSIAIITW